MGLNEAEKHALNLGKLAGNLQSLEFALRAFLVNTEIASGSSFPQSTNLHDMDKGNIVPENAFTNYDTLGQLINKYNSNSRISSVGFGIDETLVDIHDAIAHRRVSAATYSGTLKLLKFDKPKNGQVKVTFSASLTEKWFAEQIKRVYGAVLKVNEANDKLQSGKL